MKLWDFATEFYVIRGVASACLSMQDEHDMDVNQLIFSAWMGFDRGVLMRPENFHAAADHVREWRMRVVRPLREVRRHMKESGLVCFHPDSADLREKVKSLELRAEKLQLDSLEAMAMTMFKHPAAAGSTTMAVENMRALLLILAGPRIAAESPALTELARALESLRR